MVIYKRLIPLILLSSILAAQVKTRTEEIEQARKQKAEELKPDAVTPAESFLLEVKEQNYIERFTQGYNGLRLKIGNMVTGSGFAIGPEYYREDLFNGELTARASAQISTRGYQKYEAQATLPRLANSKINLDLWGTHRNYSGINYYGPGPNSEKTGRSNYRLEDTSVDAILGIKPRRYAKFGGSIGGLWVNVGPGRDDRFISTDKQFPASVIPGMDTQTNFVRYGGFAQFDYRDHPPGPKQGGNYVFQYSHFKDHKLNRYNFDRFDVDLEQYIGMFNRTRVIALRAKSIMTQTNGNNVVPFYLQPILGGPDTLRGYRAFRFSDRNMVLYTAEYRWEVFAGLDGAIFADAGKVTPTIKQLNFKDLESSVGFGLRFNARNKTFIRLDVGFSHEGYQVWFRFNDVFNPRAFGTTTGQPIY